jgi:hypothetical protein
MLPSKDSDRRQEEFGVTEEVRRASGVTPIGAGLNPPDPEVPEKKGPYGIRAEKTEP